MDLFDRFAGNDSWHTRRLLEYAGTLTEEQLDRPLPTVVELLPWRESNKTLRQLLENIIFTKEVWTAALSGADMDMNGPPKSQRSPQAMLQRRRLRPYHDIQRASPIDGLGRSTPPRRPNRRFRRSHGV